jgi:hypothetical protein
VSDTMQTSVDGVFACGNVVQVHDLVDYVTQESRLAGKSAAEYILAGGSAPAQTIRTVPGSGVRYIVPQQIARGHGAKLFFRVTNVFTNVEITIKHGGTVLYHAKKLKVTPGEMESVELAAEKLKSPGDTLTVSVESRDAARKEG